tara:strand:- start:430 stop:1032 length:603 start_codon:yes stop_codon:yes gene_type:complete
MKLLLITSALAGSFAFLPVGTAPSVLPQDPQQIAEMMKKAEKFTKPGTHHELLKRFLGKWNTETHFVMGGQKTPAEKGQCEWTWLVEGRWLKSTMTGTMMGQPLSSYGWLGYDNLKQSYVDTRVSSMDTAMNHSEGDLTPDGKALITYGTLDEYLTGEHDKMVRYVWRFVSADEMLLEVHDLPIGEENTQVIAIRYQRAK